MDTPNKKGQHLFNVMYVDTACNPIPIIMYNNLSNQARGSDGCPD